ncbi:MAG: AsmA family protein [Alphaproteobacteria bacterium]|nr:AsmA family protein [Alphaproteobacteria bacterium]
MKLIMRILLALVVLVVLAVIAVPFLIPSGWIAEKVAEQVKVHTGRTLAFSQDTSLSFFPDIALTLKDARLSNPPDMPEGYVVSMETLRLKVALQPLISRKVEVQEFRLEKPAVNLLITGDGKSNWRLPETGGTPNGKSDSQGTGSLAPTDITLGPINIDGGRLRYLDERTGTSLKIDDINAAISLPKLDGAVTIKGDLVWNGEKVALDFKADEPAALAEDRASAVSFTLSAKPLAMGYAGKISLQQGFQMAGGVNVKTPNLRALARWADAPLAPGKGLGPFSVKSSLAYSNDKISLQKATLKLDGMNARGDMSVDLKGAVPFINGRLGVDKIDVNAYTSAGDGGGGDGGSAASGKWSTANIDMSGLRAVNANLSLNAGNIIYKKTTLSKAVVALTLKGGVLDAKLTNVGLYGGSAAGALRLNGARKVPALAGSLRTKGVKAYPFLKDFAGFEWLEGATAITAQVSAAGRNQASMVSTLGGTLNITFSDGAIRGVNIAKMIRGATKNILSGWEKEPSEKTDFSEFSANFNIAKGIASSNDLKLIGPLVRLNGKGTVSMPPKRLNFLISPKVVASLQGQGGLDDLSGITVPFRVEGPWANPKIYPDIEGILQNPEQAFQAFNKLLGGKNGIKGLDAKSLEKVVKKKTIKKVTKEIDKVLGEDGSKQLEELGGGLLKNLFKN